MSQFEVTRTMTGTRGRIRLTGEITFAVARKIAAKLNAAVHDVNPPTVVVLDRASLTSK